MANSRGKSSHGGKRKNAGRKPRAFAVLKRRLEEERVEDAECAFALFAGVMRDPEQDLALRLECAREVMDRVLGKPKQLNEHTGKDGNPIETTQVFRHEAAIAAIAGRPDQNPESPSTNESGG